MLPDIRETGLKRILGDVFGNKDEDKDFTPRAWDTVPAVNVKEDKKNYELEIAAPGLKKKDFNIEVDNNMLVVWAEHKDEKTKNKRNYTRREFSYSTFRRSFVLPENVDVDKISARHKGGVLHIQIPKTKEAQQKSIDIQ